MPAYKISGKNFDALKGAVIEALDHYGFTLESVVNLEYASQKSMLWEVYWLTNKHFGGGWTLQDIYTKGMNARNLYDAHIETAMRRILSV